MSTTKIKDRAKPEEPDKEEESSIEWTTEKCRYFGKCGNLIETHEAEASICGNCQGKLESQMLEEHGEDTLRDVFPDSDLLDEDDEGGMADVYN